MGAMHDFLSGVMLVRNDGLSIPGSGRTLPGHRIAAIHAPLGLCRSYSSVRSSCSFRPHPQRHGAFGAHTVWVWLILAYYFVATLLPIDKIIGTLIHLRRGPSSWRSHCWACCSRPLPDPRTDDVANAQLDPHSVPIVTTLFITIACGAIRAFTPRSRR